MTPFWQRARNMAYGVTAVACLLMSSLVAYWPATAFAEPLSSEQQSRALKLTDELAWPATESAGSAELAKPAESANSTHEIEGAQGTQSIGNHQTHELGLQTISIEQDVIKNNNTHQQVRVYQHSYSHNSARVVVVSLANNQVVRQSLIESAHLPLTHAEHEYALTVLSADVDAVALLKADQQRRGRTPFAHIKELSVKASIYKPLDKNHLCIHERCALLSLFDATNTVFAAEPIVNLQHGAVDWLNR